MDLKTEIFRVLPTEGEGMSALDVAAAIFPDWTTRALKVKKNQIFGILVNAERWDQVKRTGLKEDKSVLWVKT